MTDYQIVKKQIEHLYIIQEHVPIINAVNCWNVKGRQIGERTNKLTLENYHEVYKKMLEEQEFHLLINDESVISLFICLMKMVKLVNIACHIFLHLI